MVPCPTRANTRVCDSKFFFAVAPHICVQAVPTLVIKHYIVVLHCCNAEVQDAFDFQPSLKMVLCAWAIEKTGMAQVKFVE